MEELNQKLAQILQDPERMQQIAEMASAIGLKTPSEVPEIPVTQEALQQVSQVMHHLEERDSRQQTLVRALLPYLSPGRRGRLERAMQISHLSRVAGAALQNNSLFSILSEEGSDV